MEMNTLSLIFKNVTEHIATATQNDFLCFELNQIIRDQYYISKSFILDQLTVEVGYMVTEILPCNIQIILSHFVVFHPAE